MARGIALLGLVGLTWVVGCASIAGVEDLKKEGEGGKGLEEACGAPGECGSGLTCVSGSCLRKCYDIANPVKECAALACVPLESLTEAVCFLGGTNSGGPCTLTTECTPGFSCVELTPGEGGRCAHYCHDDGRECGGSDVCHRFLKPITLDGVEFGVCGPITAGSSSGGS